MLCYDRCCRRRSELSKSSSSIERRTMEEKSGTYIIFGDYKVNLVTEINLAIEPKSHWQ